MVGKAKENAPDQSVIRGVFHHAKRENMASNEEKELAKFFPGMFQHMAANVSSVSSASRLRLSVMAIRL